MPTFTFDDTADFQCNLNAFLEHMAGDDPELADILRTHISKLHDTSDDSRRRAARLSFNASVKSALDALLKAKAAESES